ncbi:diiron oxygenase [Ideonella livida]|uniref:Ferritin-like domain-containing protein n=1 Tax=Ideonella livida TaxID=2707176 RepID=A0A7C9TL76_9BURK|nr:diiron oxygenase [Ideonella livida]NDY91825.1 hypothetical protein [Ideonella livida]
MTDLQHLFGINAQSHVDTVHPRELAWPEAFGPAELAFLSDMAFEAPGHERGAVAYVAKELAQLAEIERHVSAVLTYVMAEMQAHAVPLSSGFALHDALSCFAAEELHHANMFYRYVRLLSGQDFGQPDNLFSQRVALYQGDDSPFVKLAALCASAYVGESVITVFERRAHALDPGRRHFFTQLLHAHGLDEARHVQTDHFVFEQVVPTFTLAERRRMQQILEATEALNAEVALRFQAHAQQTFGLDYTAGNRGHAVQLQLTQTFRRLVWGAPAAPGAPWPALRRVDDAMDDAGRRLIESFSASAVVHHAAGARHG